MLAPHADLTALGPADSNFINLGGDIANLDVVPRISFKANFITDSLRVLVIPEKGSTIESNLGLTLVGNTLKTEIILRIQTITNW
jgi:hypothetical protein